MVVILISIITEVTGKMSVVRRRYRQNPTIYRVNGYVVATQPSYPR